MVRDRANPRLQKAFEELERAVRTGAPDCGDLAIAIDRDGTWTYRGSPIRRLELVKLFASVLRRTGDGRYWLVTPGERGTVAVADVPFLVLELRRDGDGRDQTLHLRTNLDEWVTLGPDRPLRFAAQPDGSSAPYVHVRDGLEARLARTVYYDLVEHAVVGTDDGSEERLGVWSGGTFLPLEAA
jgi:uncharacterized protein